MPIPPFSGVSFDKVHAVTITATAPVEANRFIGYAGAHASTTGAVQCVSESAAQPGEAFSGVTAHSYPVQASEALAFGDYVKPASDGTGRAAKGTATDFCARALQTVSESRLVECELLCGGSA